MSQDTQINEVCVHRHVCFVSYMILKIIIIIIINTKKYLYGG